MQKKPVILKSNPARKMFNKEDINVMLALNAGVAAEGLEKDPNKFEVIRHTEGYTDFRLRNITGYIRGSTITLLRFKDNKTTLLAGEAWQYAHVANVLFDGNLSGFDRKIPVAQLYPLDVIKANNGDVFAAYEKSGIMVAGENGYTLTERGTELAHKGAKALEIASFSKALSPTPVKK